MLKARLFLSVLLMGFCSVSAQNFSYKIQRNIAVAKFRTIRFTDIPETMATLVEVENEAPEPWSDAEKIKEELDRNRKRRFTQTLNKYQQEPEDVLPANGKDFDGLPSGSSEIPNDNNMAISNNGTIISVINSSVSIFSSDGNRAAYRTLANIVSGQLPNLNRTYDPKVVYDPLQDRFILVFLQGSTSADTRIIIGFTATADPLDVWNFYAVNGNPFGGTKWSDYPIIGISKEDLYVTVNILRDNESWQEGFTQSVIWQVNKASGYNGLDTIYQDLFHDLTYNNKPIWSICVVPDDFISRGRKGMYFLSVRPGDASNDTLFLHHIDNDQQSGTAKYSLKVLKTSQKYGVPPSALQPDPTNVLQTNDTRVLSGFAGKDHIQYVQTTIIPGTGVSGIFHGIIDLNTFTVENNYITSDTFEYAYPSISHAGSEEDVYASVITFSHVSELDFPGTSGVFHNKIKGHESIYSKVVMIRAGEVSINRLANDSNERWGDYTGIQQKYSDPNHVWMSGSYGKSPNRNSVWIGELIANTELNLVSESAINFYPNPAAMWSTISYTPEKDRKVYFALVDSKGAVVYRSDDLNLQPTTYEYSVNMSQFRAGVYHLVVIDLSEKKKLGSLEIMNP
ncbi:MAG: hypothetical protein GC181_05925 [Bacteroidetes bacterium]|nr:hypothetical protein [Bacteroidota bacterium]